MRVLVALLLLTGPALAQAPVPFTDWRATLDADLARLSMPRDAHQAIFQILQAYERQAQQQAQQKATSDVPFVRPSPKSLIPPSIPPPRQLMPPNEQDPPDVR
jgi:hypothetical protein